MRFLSALLLFSPLMFSALPAQAQSKPNPEEIPWAFVETKDILGHVINEEITYVEGENDLPAAEAFLNVASHTSNAKLIVSTDDENNPDLAALAKPVAEARAFRFTFIPGGSSDNAADHFGKFIKNHPTGIFMAVLQTAVSSYFYIHFSTHHELLPIWVTISFTAIQNLILTANPSIWFPVVDSTKEGEGRIARWLGIPTQNEAFKLTQDISMYTLGQVALSVMFHTLITAHPLAHGPWSFLKVEGVAAALGLFNAFTTSSFSIAVKRLRRSPTQPLDTAEINHFIGLKNIFLAALIPEVYRGSIVAVGLTTGFGLAGWYTVWRGESFIPKLKASPQYQHWKEVGDLMLDTLFEVQRKTATSVLKRLQRCQSLLD